MKTVTMRVDDATYQVIKTAADGEKRNLSNFIEYAILQYLSSTRYVEADEMDGIMRDGDLVKNLRSGLEDTGKGDFTLV
jgi:predicted transcriptional regulator